MVETKANCKLGYCVVRNIHYGGGSIEHSKCPVCNGRITPYIHIPQLHRRRKIRNRIL